MLLFKNVLISHSFRITHNVSEISIFDVVKVLFFKKGAQTDSSITCFTYYPKKR